MTTCSVAGWSPCWGAGASPGFRGQELAVVGGGDTALEEAMYLTKYGKHVHLLVRSKAMRASKTMQVRPILSTECALLRVLHEAIFSAVQSSTSIDGLHSTVCGCDLAALALSSQLRVASYRTAYAGMTTSLYISTCRWTMLTEIARASLLDSTSWKHLVSRPIPLCEDAHLVFTCHKPSAHFCNVVLN